MHIACQHDFALCARHLWPIAEPHLRSIMCQMLRVQGLVTRDVGPLSEPHAAPQYAALLNSKGRVMYDLFLHREQPGGTQSAILMDCPAPGVQQLKANLTKFKLHANVSVEDTAAEMAVVARWSLGTPSISDVNLPDPPGVVLDLENIKSSHIEPVQRQTHLQAPAQRSSMLGRCLTCYQSGCCADLSCCSIVPTLMRSSDRAHAGLPPDPRHLLLGARAPVRLQHSTENVPPYSGALLGVTAASEDAYRALRYSVGIAEGPSEIPSGAAAASSAAAACQRS